MFNPNPKLEYLKQFFKCGGNPAGMLPPQVQEMLKANGNNYEQVFYQMCKQQGINPQEILDYLRK